MADHCFDISYYGKAGIVLTQGSAQNSNPSGQTAHPV